MKLKFCLLFVSFFLVLVVPAKMIAQESGQQSGPVVEPAPHSSDDSEATRLWKRDLARKANKQRQEEIQHDTEKLFKLATELKDYVGKTDEHVLSLDVIKKAEEIEKLAHDVKEKMKTGY